ncbi:MAG: hypothetical protein J3Q66DRAFT_440553 [Benniella sp.]|nr:MAG: hypothetical protein J3Q66DRAFT_440553 [Benniella sp.]
MAMGALGLYLEVLEFIGDYKLYLSSPYNLMDVIGFLIPTIGCIQLLFSIVVNDNTDTIGKSYLLSYGLGIAYIEIINELRIFRGICNVTTIIWNIAGQFDSVNDYLWTKSDWGFSLMVGSYYAFTVFLMFNILIALMNTAFARVEDEGILAWVDCHYRHVGASENQTFAAPGFRERGGHSDIQLKQLQTRSRSDEQEPQIRIDLKRIRLNNPGAQTSRDNDLWFGAQSEELRPGYYTITWCMGPMNYSRLSDLIFEAETCSTKCKLWAKTSIEEIEPISPKDPSSGLRLRLQQKLHLEHSSKVVVRLSIRLSSSPDVFSGQESEFGARSVELVRLGTEAPGEDFDYEVKAPGKMLLQHNVTPDEKIDQIAPILAADVSASGEYIAILSADHKNAYVYILDISAVQKSACGAIRASHAIPLQDDQFDSIQLVGIAISYNGAHVVIYQKPNGDNLEPRRSEPASVPFPFHALQLNCITAKDLLTTDRQSMSPVEGRAIQQLKDRFLGYGKFLSRDRLKSGNEEFRERDNGAYGDYFVAINESRINVYDVDNNWKPLFGYNIGDLVSMESRTKQLRMLHQSISGSQFVWMEDGQNVSVWDLESGANVKYISVNNPDTLYQDEISHLAVSPGGKLLALAGKNWIRTYFMDSCIAICTTTIDDGTVMNIEFIDKDKSLLVTIRKPSMEQTSVIMDAMNLPSWPSHKREFPSSCSTSLHVARLSNGPQDGFMMAVNWNMLEVYDIPQPVSIGGVPLVDCQEKCATETPRELNQVECQANTALMYRLVVNFEERKDGEKQQMIAHVRLLATKNQGEPQCIMTITPEPWKSFNVDVDADGLGCSVRASFLSWPQFIITTASGFQVWNLPHSDSDNRCELALSWVKPCWKDTQINGGVESYVATIRETVVCEHGRCVTSTWINNGEKAEHVRIPKTQWSTPSETTHCINSYPVLASCYFDSDAAARGAIIRYIIKHINRDPSGKAIGANMMDAIAKSAKWKCCSDILDAILRSTDGKWIPRCTPTMRVRDGRQPANPISVLLKNAGTDPYALSMAQELMNYCIREAKSQGDPAFLHPVSGCLPELVDHHRDIAIDITRRSSFILVRNKRFVIDRAIFAPPLPIIILDWVMRKKRTIYEYQDLVLQLKSQLPSITAGDFTTHVAVANGRITSPVNSERFKEKLYVAPYSLLWHYRDEDSSQNRTKGIVALVEAVATWIINQIVALALCIIMWIMTIASKRSNFICTIITMGCHAAAMIVDILNPLHKPVLRLNFRSKWFHDSPAIASLTEYRWNSFAWMSWLVQFLYQGAFFVVICFVTGLQIYPLFKIWYLITPIVIIMAMGALGLYLEVLEFIGDYKLYLSSPYNLMDVIGFLIPTIGCIQLLFSIVVNDNTDTIGKSYLLSYGLGIAYIEIINELRIFRGICNVTTIIWNIVYETRFFFALLAITTIAGTHILLHMLRGKSNDCLFVDENGNTVSDPWDCPVQNPDFPQHPFGAYTAAFFILAGQFDSVSGYLWTKSDWGFSLMVGSYYAFTVFLMFNILIALMNTAFARVEDEGIPAWVDCHYRHVGAAENQTFAAPGFRQRFDLFPQYVYYTVSQKRVEEFGKNFKDPQENEAG